MSFFFIQVLAFQNVRLLESDLFVLDSEYCHYFRRCSLLSGQGWEGSEND